MQPNIQGLDLSNNNTTVDAKAIANSNVSFVFHKATEGLTFRDHDYALRGTSLMAHGVAFGAYHYARVHEDAAAQVGHFLNVARLHPGMLVPFVDIEGQGNEGATKQQWYDWLAIWFHEMLTVHQHRCGLYVSPGFADFYDFGALPWLRANYLFVAHWGVQKPRIPAPWKEAAIWQYTSTGHTAGVSGDVDKDRWLATFDSLTVGMTPGWGAPPRFPIASR